MSDVDLDVRPDLAEEASPVLPHLASDFLLWVWWTAEQQGGSFDLGEDLGAVDCWVDSRLAFRTPDEGKAMAVLTGENPADTPEARAAVAGGKVLRELRLGMRREDREFGLTLRAPHLDLAAVRLPQVVQGEGEEALYDRMFLYEELHNILVALFQRFAEARADARWAGAVAPAIRAWVAGRERVGEE